MTFKQHEQDDAPIVAVDITSNALSRQQHLNMNAPKKEALSESDINKLHQLLHDFYLPFFKDKRKTLLITNEKTPNKTSACYAVTITKQKMVYEIKSDVKKDETRYDFDKREIFHNNDKKDGQFLSEFVDKLEKMSADIRNNKTDVYEEFDQ